MTNGLHLGKVEITGYHLIQNPQFFLRQIILGNPNIFCRGKIPGKGGKPHKWLIRIGPLIDHFRSRMSMRCIMKLVLHHFEKRNRFRTSGVIVHTGGVQVQHLTIHHFFRRTNVPNPFQQFAPIVATAQIFQALIVHREALDHIFFQALRGPPAKLGGNQGFYPVPQRNDHVQIIERQLSGYLPVALHSNLSEFPTG